MSAGPVESPGPLAGLRVIEVRGIGPAPLAAMMLADMGATVIRVDRPGAIGMGPADSIDAVHRNKRSIEIDLKYPEGKETLLRLVEHADVLIESNRPGVMERLDLGPDVCRQRNARLVYARMTGWGQTGPYARTAGHDLNYIAIAGILEGIGRPGQPPVPPLNYVGDYGGGTLFLLFGVLAAVYEVGKSGQGQVVDVAMVDGAAVLSTQFHAMLADRKWSVKRGENLIDGSSPHYDVYECSDGRYVSVAPNEPQFYSLLRDQLELTDPLWDEQYDRSLWPRRKEVLKTLFLSRTRDEWCELLEYSDVCFAPVLSMVEAPEHPHNKERKTFVEAFGVVQPAPAPRFSRTPGGIRTRPPVPGEHSREILHEAGFTADEVASFIESKAVG
jgi:alpha-methylacyl-CoA racemase